MKKIMKNYLYITAAVVFFILSCEKDSTDDPAGTAKNSHRITQIAEYDENDSLLSRKDFTYEGEKLILIAEYDVENGELIETEKTEFVYENESAMGIEYVYINSWDLVGEVFYKISDSTLWETEYYAFDHFDLQWKKMGRTVYNYSSGNLDSVDYYNTINNELVLVYKDEFQYSIGQVSLYLHYFKDQDGEWINDRKTDFYYNGDLLSHYIYMRPSYENLDSMVNYSRYELAYSGNNVSEKKLSWWTWTSQDPVTFNWEYIPDFTTYYTYNSNNYLIEESRYEGTYITKYVYEEGNGNASLILRTPVTNYIYKTPGPK